jgi:UDP-N-acetylglucosamine--N-acetylmuramyl-(pentapeptide) pyrophosphoryl-undecaprenol N-acetylglucosamine transferase
LTRFLLTGGGTAGHVNPLLATAESLKASGHEVLVLGTEAGLEARLVPQRGFELVKIAKLPFPRKLGLDALRFPFRLAALVGQVSAIIKSREIDCVVGFGGYVSAPGYLAAALTRRKLVIHEANALPGIANRLGALVTKHRAVAFANTPIRGALVTGMPLRAEITARYDKDQARVELGLEPDTPTLLVTGGSLGARRINETIAASADTLAAAGIQVYHIVGGDSELPPVSDRLYQRVSYCDRMDVAIAASDFAISRAGASTVSEFAAVGLPALFVPYPVGNGEQRLNAQTVVAAGGAMLVADAEFSPEVVFEKVIPLISAQSRLAEMSEAAKSVAIADGTERLTQLVLRAMDT